MLQEHFSLHPHVPTLNHRQDFTSGPLGSSGENTCSFPPLLGAPRMEWATALSRSQGHSQEWGPALAHHSHFALVRLDLHVLNKIDSCFLYQRASRQTEPASDRLGQVSAFPMRAEVRTGIVRQVLLRGGKVKALLHSSSSFTSKKSWSAFSSLC